MAASRLLFNLIFYLAGRYGERYDILLSTDVSFPQQDFTCNLGIFLRAKLTG